MDYKLSRLGYSIPKTEKNSNIIKEVKKELMVKPNVNTDYCLQPKPYPIYRESLNRLYIPKHYGLKIFGAPNKTIFPKPEEINPVFKGSLRPIQQEVVETFINKKNGIICLGCGQGKTVIAINIISRIKKKTIVVVHKEFLVNQWIERINQFLPEARIGKIQGKVFDIENKDIVIAMLQSLSQKEFDKNAFDSFGLSVSDECHHLSAETFSKALPKIACEYTLGLSATPKRKDGLSKVFEWYLGPIIFKQKKKEIDKVYIKKIYFTCNEQSYGKEINNYLGKLNIAAMINYISDLNVRNKLIVEQIKEIVSNENRKIIILSDRRGQLNAIQNIIESENICTVGQYVGGMKQKALKESESKTVILATFNMASEAMDIPLLNTLIFGTSKSEIEQSVGRILRQKKEDRIVEPLIIDIIDNYSIFARQAIKREKFYNKNKYIYIDDNIEQKHEKDNFIDNCEKCLID